MLREYDNINDGIGTPSLHLVLCLLIAWVVIVLVLIKGIQSSGKASYFLALFPYVIMGVLLIRALTLPGSWNGIYYFIKPQWDKILEPQVSIYFGWVERRTWERSFPNSSLEPGKPLYFRFGMQPSLNASSRWLSASVI